MSRCALQFIGLTQVNIIHETALGLIQLPDTKAMTLFGIIKDVLLRCSLPITHCSIGQAYDGASNMTGVRNGVQALMKK